MSMLQQIAGMPVAEVLALWAARRERHRRRNAVASSRGIMRAGGDGGKRLARVQWRPILTGDELDDADTAPVEEEGSQKHQERLEGFFRAMRLPALTYDSLAIPMRIAFAHVLVEDPVWIVLDAIADAVELANVYMSLRREQRVFAARHGGHAASAASAANSFEVPPYTVGRLLFHLISMAIYYFTRWVHIRLGPLEPWLVAQSLRCIRLRDLVTYMGQLNSDLSTNVALFAVFRFSLVVISVPHWIGCVWWILAEISPTGQISEDPRAQLPSWPAQFAHFAGERLFKLSNGAYDPELHTTHPLLDMQRYAITQVMAWGGVTSMGYGEIIMVVDREIWWSSTVMIVQIVFYAFVLGTLFHYLVRADENTVRFKALLKAVEEYATRRNLPPDASRKMLGYFEFQHKKRASGSEAVFQQMPLSLRLRIATARYYKLVERARIFYQCNPQFLDQLVMTLRERYLMPSEVCFERGDGSRELLWCASGVLHVTKGDEHIATIRSDLGSPPTIGEIAFILGIVQPYTVAASAGGEVTLLLLDAASFDELIAIFPEQANVVLQNLLRPFGLSTTGEDVGTAVATDHTGAQTDEDGALEWQEMRATVRLALLERNDDSLNQMIRAASDGDVDSVRSLAARGLDLNACNYDGRTTLHLAAAEGNARVVELLCQLGADATIRDRWGNTPIKDAIDGSYDAVIDALRAHGITLEVAQPALLLCEAAATGDLQRLTKLLANGVDPNTGDYDGRTPLHLAAASGNLRVVEFLVGQMADVSVADKSGAKPVDDAIAHQRTLVTQLLIASGSHPDELAMAQRLARAAEIGDVEQAKFLIEMGVWIDTADYDGRTALHLAARAGSLSTVDYLIGAKADMDASDRWGNTPLIDALRASNEAAALFMSNSDAKLPPYCADDPTLRALLACARAQKMTLINRKLKHRAELRAHVEVQKRASKRELRVALKKLADEMVRLYRVSFPLYGLICRSTPRWITSYSATADAELSSDDDDDDSGSDDNSDDDNSDDDSSDDDVDAKSPARSVGGTTELITREAAIETLPPAADAAADADANAASVSTTFTRLVLRLPRAEGGLDALRRAFASRFAAGSLSLLPSAERAAAEARALLALLELDLGLARADCERAVGEVRAALGGKGALDDAKSLSRASQGLYMADVGFACIFASAHLRGLLGRHAAMRQREAAASLSALAAAAAPPNSPDVFARLAGFSRPSATYDADSPVHPEEGSPRADPALRRVQTDAQMARTVLSRWQRPTDAVTQAGENSVSTRARIASLDASYGPATVRRPSILSKLSVTASTWRRPRLSAAADGAAGGGAQTHPPAASPDSRSATSRWRSRIVMGARVEPLSLASEAAPRLRNPLLEEAASAVALIDQLFAVFDSAGRGQIRMRDVLRSQASLGSEMGGAEIKSLINHLRAASAELSSRAGARARVLTRAHFFLGVSSWVLASARDDDDPDDLSAEDAAAAAAARAAKADDDDAEGGRPAEQRRGARGGRLMVESVGPTFDEQLANPAALEALADSIQLRLDFARLRKDDAVDADQLKGLLVNTLALEPRAVQREALERWALRELGVEISARGLMRTHTRRLSPRVPTLVTTRARSSRGSGGSSEQVGAQASVRASAAMTPRSDQPTAARGPSQTALSAVPLGASGAPFKLVDGATLGAPVLRCEWSELALALRSRAAHLRALVGEVVVVDAAAPQPSWLRRVLGYCAEGLGLRRSAAAELARAQGGLVGGAQLSRPWYVVPHDSARLRWFNALINACLCWDLILVPVSLTFFEQTSMMDWFEDLAIAIDSVYVLRMCVRLHTSYVNERSVYVVDPREVRRQYLSTDFTYDLVCSLPLDLLAKALGADRLVVSALRLPRLLLCLYLLRTYRRWEKRQADDDLKVGLLHLLFILLLFAHYCACGWNMLGFEYTGAYTGEGPLIASTWVGRWNALVAEAGIASEWDLAAEGSPAVLLARRYSISLNMSLSMLTTLGFNQMPMNYAEVLFVIAMAISNVTVFAYVVGKISALVMKQDDEIVTKRAQLEVVAAYLTHIKVPDALKEQAETFFRVQLRNASLSAVRDEDIVAAMPIKLQIEVAKHTNRTLVGEAKLLGGCAAAFMDRLSSMLRERTIEPETLVFGAGDVCRELLLIDSGGIELSMPADEEGTNGDGEESELLGPGDTVAEISVVFGIRHFKRGVSVSEVDTHVFSLSSVQYRSLIKSFPQQEEIVMDNAMRQYDGGATSRSGRSKASSSGVSGDSSWVDKGAAAFGTAGSHGSSINGSIISGANSQKTGASHASTAAAADLQGIQQVITSAKKRREEVHTLRLCDAAAKGNLKLVQRFLSASRIDVNRGDSDGRRPLHLAACAGEVKVLELLISALADVNVRDKRDGSPLADALRHRHGAAAELLHAHGAVSDIAGRAELACFCAADATRADELSYLVRFQAEQAVENHDMRTPLHIAASSGHADHVVLLLANGADCNALDRSGCTPLRDAFKRGNAGCSEILLRHGGHMGANFDAAGHMCAAAAVDDTETLRRLLQHGCALNARNSDDRTPLHLAAANARLAATTLLLSQEGIETNAEDRFGYTPLDDAERASGKRYQVIQPLLTTHGATRGSAKLRLFGCSHSEEARAEIEVAVVSTQRTAAQQALNLRALVRAEVERAQRMRKYVDQALAIEHEEGEVLADAMPKIWQHLKSFATKHDARKEVFAGKLTPTIAQWSEAQGVGAELSVVSDLARKANALHALQLQASRDFERLVEVEFRGPTVADSTRLPVRDPSSPATPA